MEIIIDGKEIKNKETLFYTLKAQINSSEFHGDNLDALWDVLTYLKPDLNIHIRNYHSLKDNLGDYALSLIELFEDLKAENQKVEIKIS